MDALSVHLVTIFPELFCGFLDASLIGKARASGRLAVSLHNPRDFADAPHYKVDDTPYGGGAGMVMRPEPLAACLEDIKRQDPSTRIIYLSPSGAPLTQTKAKELSACPSLTLLCGRYEGIDERVIELLVDEEISIGDYVVMGGETPAMVLMEAVTRLIPNVIGNEESLTEESFHDSPLLEGAHYTKPPVFRGLAVPEVLLSGHHKRINEWRRQQALKRTRRVRPELVESAGQAVDLSVVLLHEDMVDKQGKVVTTSLTMIDVHDVARSSTTYDLTNAYIAHPAPALQKLARTLKRHWYEGFGATYNPNRKAALDRVRIVSCLDEAIAEIEARTGKLPILAATSAHQGGDRISYARFRREVLPSGNPVLVMFGTGWGMADALLGRAQYFLDPILGPGEYNHLSVRSACAIVLDRLRGR